MLNRHVNRRTAGFSLVELMITITIASILAAIGLPSFSTWIQNTKVRTVTETLKNGIQLAQTEATRRSRQVTFSLTNASPALNATAVANGLNWYIQTAPLLTGESAEYIQGSQLAGAKDGVTINSNTVSTLTFNSLGRLSGGAAATSFGVSRTGSDRPLRVTVSPSGQVRMCDPSQTLSSSTPTGC